MCLDRVALLEQVAANLQHQARQGLGAALHIGEDILVALHHALEIDDVRLAIEDICIVVNAFVERLIDIALVRNLTHDLLQDILQRHQTLRSTILVHNDSHVDFILLKVAQQVVNLLMLGNKINLAQQLLPAELIAVVDIGQQVLDVERTLDIIQILVIDGDTRVTRLDDYALHLLVRRLDVHRRDVDARAHNLLDLGIHEVHDSRQHLVLLLRRGASQIDCVGQLLDRDLGIARCQAAQAATRTHQDI